MFSSASALSRRSHGLGDGDYYCALSKLCQLMLLSAAIRLPEILPGTRPYCVSFILPPVNVDQHYSNNKRKRGKQSVELDHRQRKTDRGVK